MKQKNALSLKTLTKSSVWDIQENDIFRLWEEAEKEIDLKDNMRRYMGIIKSAFDIEEVKVDKPEIIKKYETRGFYIGELRMDGINKQKWAIKKRTIMRVTDLTYENIRHISATKLLEVLERNFGGGWDSLSQSIKDIIESGFDISTTTLPQTRLHKAGGMYEKKVSDGFEALEIPKGAWVEAIFAKAKPVEDNCLKKLTATKQYFDEDNQEDDDNQDDDDDNEEMLSNSNIDDDDDDAFDEDKLTEESYRTTFDTNPEDLDLEAGDIADDEY